MNRIIDLTTPMFCFLLGVGSGIGWLLWKKHNCKFRYWVLPLFICYLLMLVKLTMFPIHLFDKETLNEIKKGAGKYFVFFQFIPFASIKHYFQTGTIVQFLGNIVLLSPFVIFLEIILYQHIKAWKVVLIASSTSLFIEIVQLASNLITGHPSRVADVDDLILNIVGIVITIALTRTVPKIQVVRRGLQKLVYR